MIFWMMLLARLLFMKMMLLSFIDLKNLRICDNILSRLLNLTLTLKEFGLDYKLACKFQS